MAGEGNISGYAGEEISLIFEKLKIASIQNATWKESQSKTPIRGAGYAKAHGMGRGTKTYEVGFEIKEWNGAVISKPVNASRGTEDDLNSFVIDGVEYSSILDLKNCTMLFLHPTKNNLNKTKKFTGVEFTDVEGGFSLDDDAITMKLTGIALDAEGLI